MSGSDLIRCSSCGRRQTAGEYLDGTDVCASCRRDPAGSSRPVRATHRLPEDRLLEADEVALMLSVPTSWVRQATRSGAMPSVELGRYRRYRRADVLAWVESCSKPGRPVQLRRGMA